VQNLLDNIVWRLSRVIVMSTKSSAPQAIIA
jgi:hypothetical protein